jgi:hypothetical protein
VSRRGVPEEGRAESACQGLAGKKIGGSGEIRTHGGLTPTAVFKTAALNHSATLPWRKLSHDSADVHEFDRSAWIADLDSRRLPA